MLPENTAYIIEAPLIDKQERLGEYEILLHRNGISFTHEDPYLFAGKRVATHGWIVHVSIIASQIPQALIGILPILSQAQVPFKLAANPEAAKAILSCQFGYNQVGKILAVYPSTDAEAVAIALRLIEVTKAFKGPDVLTDRHLGNAVFVRYGAHQPIVRQGENGIQEFYYEDLAGSLVMDIYSIPFALPPNKTWPFDFVSSDAPKTSTILRDRYRPIEIIKEDPRGNVSKSLRVRKWEGFNGAL